MKKMLVTSRSWWSKNGPYIPTSYYQLNYPFFQTAFIFYGIKKSQQCVLCFEKLKLLQFLLCTRLLFQKLHSAASRQNFQSDGASRTNLSQFGFKIESWCANKCIFFKNIHHDREHLQHIHNDSYRWRNIILKIRTTTITGKSLSMSQITQPFNKIVLFKYDKIHNFYFWK